MGSRSYEDDKFYLPKINYCPTDIKHRLPNLVFTGPKGLHHQRVPQVDYPHEIGIGKASKLRSLDAAYLTRGSSGTLLKQRRDYPGEIGWTFNYFRDIYPASVSSRRPTTNVPR